MSLTKVRSKSAITWEQFLEILKVSVIIPEYYLIMCREGKTVEKCLLYASRNPEGFFPSLLILKLA